MPALIYKHILQQNTLLTTVPVFNKNGSQSWRSDDDSGDPLSGRGRERRGRPGGGCGQRRRGPHLSDNNQATLADHVVKHGLTLTASSTQPRHKYCCKSNSDISTRAEEANNFSLLSLATFCQLVQCSLLYAQHQYLQYPFTAFYV